MFFFFVTTQMFLNLRTSRVTVTPEAKISQFVIRKRGAFNHRLLLSKRISK